MPELTPERLREIEARCEAAKTDALNGKPGVSFEHALRSADDIPDLLAALKQARQERDQFAAALAYARSDIANCFVGCNNCGHSLDLKDLDLMSEIDKVLADPAECLRARDAEIRQQACVEAIVVARETAGTRDRIIPALHDHFAKDLPESAAELIWAQADRVEANRAGGKPWSEGSDDRH